MNPTAAPAVIPPVRPAGRRNGYSLIELLVVVSFIAILASIALPRFPFLRSLAADAAAKGDLQNAMKAEEVYYANHGEYAAFSVASGGGVADPEFDASAGVTVTATLVDEGVRIVASHAASGTTWCISTSSSRVEKGATC